MKLSSRQEDVDEELEVVVEGQIEFEFDCFVDAGMKFSALI